MSSLSDDMRLIIEFVKEVEQHPCLYDFNHIEYGNKNTVDAAWKEIGKRFKGLTENDLKIKWRSVRSSYTRSFRIKKPYYLNKYLNFLIPFTKSRHINRSWLKKMKRENGSQAEKSEEDDDGDDNSSESNSCTMEIERTKGEDDDYDDDDEEQNGNIQVSTLPVLKVGLNKREVRRKGRRSKILSQYTKSRLSPHECYLRSLMPDISAMSQRQFFGFRKGILNILGKIKYGDTRNIES